MNLIPYQECQKSLDFQPENPWPKSWPAFAWEKTIIAGFTHTRQSVLNFTASTVQFLHLFHTCHPQLNLSELGRIISQWSEHEKKLSFSWKDFLILYGLNQDSNFLIKHLKIFISTPSAFQNWTHKKSIHLNELRILNSLENPKQIYFLLEWIGKHDVSHALGLKAMELGIELLLMGCSPDEILSPDIRNTSPESVVQVMEQKRKPLTFSQDQIKKETLRTIPWPAHVTTEWRRKGDKTGLEIKIWCQNQKELKEKIEKVNLLSIFEKLKQKSAEKESNT